MATNQTVIDLTNTEDSQEIIRNECITMPINFITSNNGFPVLPKSRRYHIDADFLNKYHIQVLQRPQEPRSTDLTIPIILRRQYYVELLKTQYDGLDAKILEAINQAEEIFNQTQETSENWYGIGMEETRNTVTISFYNKHNGKQLQLFYLRKFYEEHWGSIPKLKRSIELIGSIKEFQFQYCSDAAEHFRICIRTFEDRFGIITAPLALTTMALQLGLWQDLQKKPENMEDWKNAIPEINKITKKYEKILKARFKLVTSCIVDLRSTRNLNYLFHRKQTSTIPRRTVRDYFRVTTPLDDA